MEWSSGLGSRVAYEYPAFDPRHRPSADSVAGCLFSRPSFTRVVCKTIGWKHLIKENGGPPWNQAEL